MKIGKNSWSNKTLAKRVHRKVFRDIGHTGGHVHFHISGHPDHIILICRERELGKVVAKSPTCEKGECLRWDQSSFACFDRENILKQMAGDISLIRIDVDGVEMSWPTLEDFLSWLQISFATYLTADCADYAD